MSDFAGSTRVRNRTTASTTTQTRKATMLMRSHSPAKGVGRFAWTCVQAGQDAEREENHDRRNGVETEPHSDCSGSERHSREHQQTPDRHKDQVCSVGERCPPAARTWRWCIEANGHVKPSRL